ncbi:MAG: hypothetical protein ACREXY_10240 [Gammaproteobacteria bacterium]
MLTPNFGGLALIKAGSFNDSYDRRVARFDWEGLFRKAPALFRCLAEHLAGQYSFTFVDSRTGLSDTTGICTTLLPDVLVVVFTPNNQSLTGIEHLVRKAVDYRTTSRDLRDLRVYPMPSRVDNQLEHFRHVWRMGVDQHPLFGAVFGYQPLFAAVFAEALNKETTPKTHFHEYFDMVQIPHSADYAYGERLCCAPSANGTSDNLSIRNSYEQFLPWLTTGAQPWQRPIEVLLDQQAEQLMGEVALETPPEDEGGWSEWFDRIAMLADRSQHPVFLQLSLLPTGRQASLALAMALAFAHRGELQRAIEWLNKLFEVCQGEEAPSLPIEAAGRLIRLWHDDATIRWTPEHQQLVEVADRVMCALQLTRRQQQAWLQPVSDVALSASWLELAHRSCERLVSLQRETLGEDYPDTLASMNKLARILWAKGSDLLLRRITA